MKQIFIRFHIPTPLPDTAPGTLTLKPKGVLLQEGKTGYSPQSKLAINAKIRRNLL